MLKKMFQSLAGNVSAEQRAIDKRNKRRRELCVRYAYNVMDRKDILNELAEIEGEANKAAVAERLREEMEGCAPSVRLPIHASQSEWAASLDKKFGGKQAMMVSPGRDAMDFFHGRPASEWGVAEDDIGCSGFPAMRTPSTDAPFYADGLVGQWDRPVGVDAGKEAA